MQQENIKYVVSKGKKKAILKGGRLGMYPAGFRIYRTSRGIKKPNIEYMDNSDAELLVYDLPCQYENTVEIKGENYYNVVNTRFYNKKRWKTVSGDEDCPF